MDAEGQAQRAGRRVGAGHRHQYAEQAGDQPLDDGALPQRRDQHQRHHHQGQDIERAQPHRDLGERIGQRHQPHPGDQAAEQRGADRIAERAAGLALARHRVAVERGDDRGRLAGYAQQDGGDEAAGNGADIHRHHHGQRVVDRHVEGQRQQQRDAHGAGDAGNGAEDDAEQRSADEIQDRSGRHDLERGREETFHDQFRFDVKVLEPPVTAGRRRRASRTGRSARSRR